jgi:hypothetical protein
LRVQFAPLKEGDSVAITLTLTSRQKGAKAKDKERSKTRARSTIDSFGAPLRSGQSYLVSLGDR